MMKKIEHVGGHDWPYIIKDDGTAEITGRPSPKPEGELVIPEKLGGRIVTSIGDEAFARCRALKEVVLPFGVTTIEEYAFFCCSGLKAVTIPGSVAIIGRYAFRGCDGLTVSMENGATTIRPAALTVRVSAGDAERVRKLLADSGVDTSRILIME